jgi:hypothetical protein
MYRQEIRLLIQQRKIEADKSIGDLWYRMGNMKLDETQPQPQTQTTNHNSSPMDET